MKRYRQNMVKGLSGALIVGMGLIPLGSSGKETHSIDDSVKSFEEATNKLEKSVDSLKPLTKKLKKEVEIYREQLKNYQDFLKTTENIELYQKLEDMQRSLKQ